MWFVPLGIAACALVGGLTYVEHRAGQRRLQRWRTAARKLGLRYEGDIEKRSLQGELRGVPVWAQYERHVQLVGKYPSAREQITLCAGGDGDIPRALSAQRDSLRLLGELLPGRDPSVGDAEFDRFVRLGALDERVCAALSQRARQLLLQLLREGGQVRDGLVLLEDHGGSDHAEGWLEQRIDTLALLAAELSVGPSTLHRRLARNATTDPVAGVRLSNLRFLVEPRLYAPPALQAATARALLSDPDLAVRLLAAEQLGAEAFPALQQLARDRTLAPAPRIQALELLGQAEAPGLEQLLGELLAEPDAPALLVAVLTGVATLQLGSLRDAVLRCTHSPHVAVRAAAARALAKLAGTPALQASAAPRLLQLLADDADEARRAAVEALGEIGSVHAVEPLLELTRGVLPRGSLQQAARTAIGRIQSRLGNVEAGLVSLADVAPLEGAVTLADTSTETRQGELALAAENESDIESRANARAPR